jgi:thymidylate synthase
MKHPEYQYLDLLQDILDNGVENVDEGTGAVSRSVFGRQIRFDLKDGFPLLTTKKMYWKGILHELYWFVSGNNNVAYLAKNGVHIWDDYPHKIHAERAARGEHEPLDKDAFIERLVNDEAFAEAHGKLPRIYSEMWRAWPAKDGRGIDQVGWVLNELKQDPNARNAIVSTWNPEYLYSMALPHEASRFPICHGFYQTSIKGGRVHMHMYQRTADMFLGVPFNIASYALLLHVFAKILGVPPGEFIHSFGDAHIYDNHLEQVREQLTREPKAFPTMRIDDAVKTIDDFLPAHAYLEGYDSYGGLKGELTVAGGAKARDIGA